MAHSLVTALRAVPGLGLLGEATLLEIVGDSANLFWPAGITVIERGGQPQGLYVVVSGAVHVTDDEGRELAVLQPGDYFGEVALLLGGAHEQDVSTVEDTEVMVVPGERFAALLEAHPEVGHSIRETATERRRASAEAAGQRV